MRIYLYFVLLIVGAGCRTQTSNSEVLPFQGDSVAEADSIIETPTTCQDGIDNDGNGLIDYPLDPSCASTRSQEGGRSYELKQTLGWSWSPIENSQYITRLYSPRFDTINSSLTAAQDFWSQVQNEPEGRRGFILISAPVYELITNNPAHQCPNSPSLSFQCPWIETGTAQTKNIFRNFFTNLAAIGGQVDRVYVNYEPQTFSVFAALNSWPRLQAIQSDTRFNLMDTRYPEGDIRRPSLASALGLPDLSQVFQSLQNPSAAVLPHIAFENLMADRMAAYMHEAIYEPAAAIFPNVVVSDDPVTHFDGSQNLFFEEMGGNFGRCDPGLYCSKGRHVGNRQTPSIGYNIDLGDIYNGGSISFDGKRPYRGGYYNAFRHNVNKIRQSIISAPSVPVSPIVACRSTVFHGQPPPAGYSVDTYQEELFHALLAGISEVVVWNPMHPWWNQVLNDCLDFQTDNAVIEKVFSEFNTLTAYDRQKVGGDFGKSTRRFETFEFTDWYKDYVLTCMLSAERRICRFSPMAYADGWRPGLSIEGTLISQSPLMFRTRQDEIVFPNGVLYRPEPASSVLGYWIVMPAKSGLPIVTRLQTNSLPYVTVSVYQNNAGNLAGSQLYFDLTESFDEDGTIEGVEWDINGDGIINVPDHPFWFESSLTNSMNFWVPNSFSAPFSRNFNVRVTDDRGGVINMSVPIQMNSYSCSQNPCRIGYARGP